MAIYKGDKKVIALYKGDKPILKRYKGTELIYELKTNNETLSFAWSGTSTSQTFKINNTSYTASTNPYTTTLTDLGIEDFTSARDMFSGCTAITAITSIPDTSEVTSMTSMFSNCNSLTSLDVSNFNTSNVTSMSGMFNYCTSLTSLDVSNFNTSNVTSMYSMFYNCNSLTSLDVSNWNTSNVTDMHYMFYGCKSLTSLDLSNWNTSKVTSFTQMFNDCKSLTSLNLSNWDTFKVTTMVFMFYNCTNLTSLDLSNWDTSNVTNMGFMFNGCSSLTSLDLSNWDTSNVTSYGSMFNGCTSLTSVIMNGCSCDTIQFIKDRLSEKGLDVSIVTSDSSCTDNLELYADSAPLTFTLNDTQYTANTTHYSMYYSDTLTNCNSAFSGTSLSNLIAFPDTSNVTDMSYMFWNCSSLSSLEVSTGFNVSNVTSMYHMFENCSGLGSLYLSNWNFSNVNDMSYMFANCSSLGSLNLDGCVIDTGMTYSYTSMFENCPLSSISMYGCDCDTIKFIADRLIDATIVSSYEEAKNIIQTENIDCFDDSTLAAPDILVDCNTPINVLYVDENFASYNRPFRPVFDQFIYFDENPCGNIGAIYIDAKGSGDVICIKGRFYPSTTREPIGGDTYYMIPIKELVGYPIYMTPDTADRVQNALGIFYYQ